MFPSRKLKVIGVTGTDGKTTTVTLIYHILKEAGKKVSMISTIEAKIGSESIETGLHVTTPGPFKIQQLLAKMVKSRSEYAVLEVTSHGLDQERVALVKFFVGIITNITHEHLDYHKTYESYMAAKAKILRDVKYRILNTDDESFELLKSKGGGQLVSFGLEKQADFSAKKIVQENHSLKFEIEYKNKKEKHSGMITVPIFGKYNVYNILAAFACASSLGIEKSKIIDALSTFKGVVGRMQYIDEGQNFDCIVDFAHTPASLESALRSLRENKKGKIIAVFGCAGERDIQKRVLMGKISTELAEYSIFTAEDPRKEDVNKIIEQISKGALSAGGIPNRTFWKIPDRAEAINTAIQTLANDGDIVAIFGKGHEKSMNINGVEYPWSDELVARNALKLRVHSW